MALQDAELIPDPADGDNEHRLRWIGSTGWDYTVRMPQLDPEAERVDIVFHGIDTIATVLIDGHERARSRNMHRSLRVAAPELRTREAQLEVMIAPPVTEAERVRDRVGERPSAFGGLGPYIRKKASDFGWDWGPSLAGSGIWRDVVIESWSLARLAAVRPTAHPMGERGEVRLDIEIERTESGRDAELTVEVVLAGIPSVLAVPPGATRITGTVAMEHPELWWPAGLGQQKLYEVDVTLFAAETPLDTVSHRIGFREITVERIPDGDGEGISFGITVNDVPLFIRGFNWIPDHTSIAAVDAARYRDRITDALDLGANLLRVWGGGVFESDHFYRLCDELGMLVWQDFLFACAAYPEEAPFPEEIEAEAKDNITRLMPHPSLAIWNANNENLWFWFLHDWEKVLGGLSWGERYYYEVLPAAVAELDPARVLLEGSPSSGGRWRDPNDPTAGVVHCWLAGDYRDYDTVKPRFVSEFGFQGPPSRPLLDSVVHEDEPEPFSPGLMQRQKAVGGTERINDVLDIHFGVPSDFDEWYWLAQLNQARAVRYGIERFRTLAPYCRGTILWQLNDCWPALSWSMIDSSGSWKPAAYAAREAFRERILVLRREAGQAVLFACNAGQSPWVDTASVELWDADGRVTSLTIDIEVPAGAARPTALMPEMQSLRAEQVLIATGGDGLRSVLLGDTDREFPDRPAQYSVEMGSHAEGVTVTITAESLMRDTLLAVELLDASAHSDINLITLLPGERRRWVVRTRYPERFTGETVQRILRTARAAARPDTGYRGLAALELG